MNVGSMKRIYEKNLTGGDGIYPGLHALRVGSMFGILAMHVFINGQYSVGAGFWSKQFIPSLTDLVYVFFAISAFGISCGYYDKLKSGQIRIEEFYKKRWIKIWPFFALLCVLDFVLSPSKEALYEMFADLTLSFGYLSHKHIQVMGVGWTLGVIFLFYIAFPYFVFLCANRRRAIFSFGVATLLNFVCVQHFEVGRNNFAYSAVYFLLGELFFLYKVEIERILQRHRSLVWLLTAVALVMYYAWKVNLLTRLLVVSSMLCWGISAKRCPHLVQFLSGVSFEVYLCHMVMYRGIEKLQLLYLFGNNATSYITVVVMVSALAVVFSTVWNRTLALLRKQLERNKTI
ncbi:hypothetical protein B5G28_08380 [Faecalibacterium sp. An77]|nr:hypothetical protein B5G28_08380 [Faecalibacterium sp. An77]